MKGNYTLLQLVSQNNISVPSVCCSSKKGIVKLEQLVPTPLRDDLAMIISRGTIPATENVGYVDTNGGSVVCDHAEIVSFDKTKLEIGPSSKDDVNSSGEIQDEGVVLLFNPASGFPKVVAAVIDQHKRPFVEGINCAHTTGRLAVVRFGLEAAEYEISDIDSETGVITAKPRFTPY